MYDLGRYCKAEEYYSEALAIRKKVLGDEHPDIAQNLQNLACVKTEQGNLIEAEEFHIKALVVRKNSWVMTIQMLLGV